MRLCASPVQNYRQFCLLLALVLPGIACSGVYEQTVDLLPPNLEWSGASESLVVAADDPWITPAEKHGLKSTPSYEETVSWLHGLVEAAPQLEMISIGKTHQGRDVWMVIASSKGVFTPEGLKASGKPLLLAQAGIHSGEIDGKDAGLMLLRDMTVAGKRGDLLQGANFLFIPILNADGHEMVSPYNRINQRGPEQMGWRTNARNQNFNRDYAKLDIPAMQSLIGVINQWQPDLYLDLHVTDGVDYQYDITFGGNGEGGWSPEIGQWLNGAYREAVSNALTGQGHIPGPLIMAVNNLDLQDGFYVWNADPRYSNGYGDARHLPSILVENHSLKPYRQRVLGTYVLLAASLEVLASHHEALKSAVSSDRARRPEQVVLGYVPSDDPPEKVPFKGIASERFEDGTASGGPAIRWLGVKDDKAVPRVMITKPRAVIEMPAAYLVPPQWSDIAQRIAIHGIPVEKLSEAITGKVQVYRLPEAKIAAPGPWMPNPFEGHVRIDPGKPVSSDLEMTFPVGTYRISTNHELGELLALLLEPESPDSFLQWGFFLEIFTRTEYAETYVMEPLAQEMLAGDPQLAAEFAQKLAADPEFAADPNARLMWFYEQTPFYDPRYLVYPVARLPAGKAGSD